jgi:hypothetical protein
MRFALLPLFAVLLLGCPGSNVPIYGDPMFTDGGCRVGCDKCPSDDFCVSVPYVPVCLKPCASSKDCQASEKCALLDAPGLYATGCVSPNRPKWCTVQPCNNLTRKCRDSVTLLEPLAASDGICGWAVVLCPNGCDLTAAQCK